LDIPGPIGCSSILGLGAIGLPVWTGKKEVVSEGYARLSGAGPRVPWGGTAERGVGGIWDIGEKPALRFRSSNAARHEFRERPV